MNPFARMAVSHAVRRGLAETIYRYWRRVPDAADFPSAALPPPPPRPPPLPLAIFAPPAAASAAAAAPAPGVIAPAAVPASHASALVDAALFSPGGCGASGGGG